MENAKNFSEGHKDREGERGEYALLEYSDYEIRPCFKGSPSLKFFHGAQAY